MVRLAVHDDFFVARDPVGLEQRRKIGAQAQRARMIHQVEPVEVHRTGNVAVAPRPLRAALCTRQRNDSPTRRHAVSPRRARMSARPRSVRDRARA